MNDNVFVSFLLSLSIQPLRPALQSPWKFRLRFLAFSTFLNIWRFYKFAYRAITGRGAIERLCQRVLGMQVLIIHEKGIEFEGTHVRNVIWRIDAEFRLSSKLVDEYATLQDVAHEHIDLDDMTSSGLSSITRELALVVQRRKHIDVVHLPFLVDAITVLTLIEMGKQMQIRQSQQDVTSDDHQAMLDEIWTAVFGSDQLDFSDTRSELTLIPEKGLEKDSVDWVKLGFQGKSPETDFRATGLLGLKQLHSFCTTYPVLARRLIDESGSSQSLQISEPWYPFALMGIHITRSILQTMAAGRLQKKIMMKVQGNITQSVARICQDMYDQLLEEFHGYWMGLVRTGIVQDVFAFEKVFSEFKRAKDLL